MSVHRNPSLVLRVSSRSVHVWADITSGGGKGGEVGMGPGGTVQEAAFGGLKIWNSKIWPLLANWRVHCRQ